MLHRNFILPAVFLACVVSPTISQAQELVENPQYISWASFKPGTQIFYDIRMGSSASHMDVRSTQKLVSLTDESATIEITGKTRMLGWSVSTPPQTTRIVAKDQAGLAGLAGLANMAGISPTTSPSTPATVRTPADQTVTIGEQTFACKVVEFETASPTSTTRSTIWTCDRVPGTIVKSQLQTENSAGFSAANSTGISMTLSGIRPKR